MRLCLFCGSQLTRSTRPEHILLDALGGRKTSRRVICSGCNQHFGSSIDRALAESVARIRNLLAHPSGTGKPAPSIRYLTPTGAVRLDSAGRPTMQGKPFTLEREEGVTKLDLRANNRDQAINSLRHIAARLGCKVDTLLSALQRGDGTGFTETFGPAPSHRGQLSIGTEDSLRSIVKSCLELLALARGNEVVRGAPYAQARCFVAEGTAGFNTERISLDSRPLPAEDELRRRFGPAFHLAYVASDPTGRTVGYFRLYGFVAWSILLAERDGSPDLRAGIACNPVTGEWSDKIGQEIDLTPAWLENAKLDGHVAAERLRQIHAFAQEAALEREVDRIVRDEFERHGIRGDVVIEDEAVKASLFGEINARIAALAARVPYARPVPWSRVEQWANAQDSNESGGN